MVNAQPVHIPAMLDKHTVPTRLVGGVEGGLHRPNAAPGPSIDAKVQNQLQQCNSTRLLE